MLAGIPLNQGGQLIEGEGCQFGARERLSRAALVSPSGSLKGWTRSKLLTFRKS